MVLSRRLYIETKSEGSGQICQLGSPKWVEERLNLNLQKIFTWFLRITRNHKSLVILSLSGLAASALMFKHELYLVFSPFKYQSQFHATWTAFKIWPILFIYSIGFFIWVLRNYKQVMKSALLYFIVLFYLYYCSNTRLTGEIRMAAILTYYVFAVIPLLLLHRRSSTFRLVYLAVATLLFIFLDYFLSGYWTQVSWFEGIIFTPALRGIIPLSFLLLEERAAGSERITSNGAVLSYIFSPACYLFNQPIKSSYLKAPTNPYPVMLQGFADLIVGLTSFYICTAIYKFTDFHWGHAGPIMFLAQGFKMSMVYFFASLGIFRLAVGVARWCGFNLPDAANYAILSVSPLESWKRWSTFLYLWMSYVIFLPSLRVTRSVLCAVMITFFAMFLLHFGYFIPHVFFWKFRTHVDQLWVINNFYFFAAHGALVYFSFVFSSFWPKASLRTGWLGVLATQFLLALVHTFVI